MNIEAKSLVGTLKAKLSALEDDLANIEDPKSKEASLLEDQIEELKAVIKYFELAIAKLEKYVPKNSAETQEVEEIWADMIKNLKELNNSKDLKAKLSETTVKDIEDAIDEMSNTSDNSSENEDDSEKEEEEEKKPTKKSEEAYQSLVEDRKKAILGIKSKRLERLKKRTRHDITGRKSVALMGYNIELKELDDMKKLFDSREKLSPEAEERLAELDKVSAANAEKIAAYKEQIERLKAMRSELVSARNAHKIDREIKRLNTNIKLLHVKDVGILNVQKAIMYPTYKVELMKQALLSRQRGKVQYYEEKQAVNEELQRMLDSDSIIDSVKKSIYEIKGAHYQKNIEKSEAILEDMKKTDSLKEMHGARIRGMTNGYLDIIREKREKRRQELLATQQVVA